MRVIIFSTETTHHTWFVREFIKHYSHILCVLEEEPLKPSFPTYHPFEAERERYERHVLLGGHDLNIADISSVISLRKINQIEDNVEFKNFKPDLIVVFGTGKISSSLVKQYQGKIINFHGGDPEYYRGLDSHLWSIYHEDFGGVVTTLHHLNESLDDGEIIVKKNLDLKRITDISQLRALNTQACLDLALMALKMYETSGEFVSYKQRHKGRYYSFMPADLKEICCKKFDEYVKKNDI